MHQPFDAVVVGGGPSGSTAAYLLAQAGWRVALIDRGGRIKPCGGAVPPRLIRDYQIPDHLLVARIRCARMISPTQKQVDIPIEDGFVGMVNREDFDEWLRSRAAGAGATRLTGLCEQVDAMGPDGLSRIQVLLKDEDHKHGPELITLKARMVIGADGARSRVAAQRIPRAGEGKTVFAYHEILRAPAREAAPAVGYDPDRCDVYYDGRFSPDFYGWMFPHGDCLSIGTGSMDKGFSLRSATQALRKEARLDHLELVRREGAPIPLKPLPVWDDGRNVVLAGDAAGVVAPASGEGIYYAMLGGELAAKAGEAFLRTGQPASLKLARQAFMKDHGRIFFVLGLLQRFWYGNDKRREQFVKICRDEDVQKITFDAYMNKRMVRRKPMAHLRILAKDIAHLLGLAKA